LGQAGDTATRNSSFARRFDPLMERGSFSFLNFEPLDYLSHLGKFQYK